MAPGRVVGEAEGSAEEEEELTLFLKCQEGCKAQTELEEGRRTLVVRRKTSRSISQTHKLYIM